MPLMLDYAASLKGQPNSTVCALATLAGLEIAAAKAQQPLPVDLLQGASQWLCSEDMRSLQQQDVQRQMVMVASNLIDLAGPAAADVAEPLFHCLMHLQGQHALDSYAMEQIAAVCPNLVYVALLWLKCRAWWDDGVRNNVHILQQFDPHLAILAAVLYAVSCLSRIIPWCRLSRSSQVHVAQPRQWSWPRTMPVTSCSACCSAAHSGRQAILTLPASLQSWIHALEKP